jgi:hypothetical protein
VTHDVASHILFSALALGCVTWFTGMGVTRFRLAKVVVKEGLASSVFFGMSGTAWLRVKSDEGRRLLGLSFLWMLGGLFGLVVLGVTLSVVLNVLVREHG